MMPHSITCTRRLQFCAGHRVLGHENKCAHLHGHNYVVHLEARVRDHGDLDALGRVVDFSVLKADIGGWIEEQWDHGFIVNDADPFLHVLTGFVVHDALPVLPVGDGDQKWYAMPYNPTAENMARYLGEIVGPTCLDRHGIELCRVTVHETENCVGTWELV